MTSYYYELLKLHKQINRLTSFKVEIKNPYTRIISRLAVRFDPRLVNLFNDLLISITKLHHLYNYKYQILVSREDILVTLSLMQNVLKPMEAKNPSSNQAYDWYETLYNNLKIREKKIFTAREAYLYTGAAKSNVRRYLLALVKEGVLTSQKQTYQPILGRKKRINTYTLKY